MYSPGTAADTRPDARAATPPNTNAAGRDHLSVNGTTLAIDRRGAGRPAILIHGGGEDAAMLAGQAESLADAGFDVITYDRRGTGRSGRDAWPSTGSAADQHADDAAAIIEALDLAAPTVVGVSSGAIVALRLAARHPDLVGHVVAWEPPMAGLLDGGAELTAQIMAPVDAHLAEHPGDFAGAQAILLSAILGFPVAADDPAFAAARENAEPMIRDEPNITLAAITAEEVAGRDITIAVGPQPNDLVGAAVAELTDVLGSAAVEVDAGHEVYFTDPQVLTSVVVG